MYKIKRVPYENADKEIFEIWSLEKPLNHKNDPK